MEVGFQPDTRHSDGLLDTVFIVHHIILGHNVNDLTARWNNHTVHILCKTLNVVDGDLFFLRRPCNATVLNKTADVLSGNSHIDHTNIDPSLVASFFDGSFYCKDGLVNVEHNSFYDTFRLGFAHAQYFEFTKLIFAANNSTYLCSANVQSDY